MLSILRKWYVFVQKIGFFKIQKMDFAKKSNFKGMFNLKTVYV